MAATSCLMKEDFLEDIFPQLNSVRRIKGVIHFIFNVSVGLNGVLVPDREGLFLKIFCLASLETLQGAKI